MRKRNILAKIQALFIVSSGVGEIINEIIDAEDPASPGGEEFTPEEDAKIIKSVEGLVSKMKDALKNPA